ncbi:MAG: PEP-CTERM sorting domain-containing protein [Planctomycetota bacterium]
MALGSGLTAVPEPNTMALLAVLGLAGAVALRRRRKSRS